MKLILGLCYDFIIFRRGGMLIGIFGVILIYFILV